ncbi:MAG: DUF4149 domain-containing protein [Limisphaera sp.]|nr:DUF4149 domain-containing protein [Limisphaera sp.]
MSGLLRFLGLVNAAVWLGAGVFFTVAVGPAVFSEEMRSLLGDRNFPYFSGAIAGLLVSRLFRLQIVCASLAVAHLLAEWAWLRRPFRRVETYCVAVLTALVLMGAFWWQPEIHRLHRIKHAVNLPAAVREEAAHRLRWWHGAAQAANLLVIAGLLLYLNRVARPADAPRFLPSFKLRS